VESISIVTRLTLQDWRALRKAALQRLRLQHSTWVRLWRLAALFAIGFGAAWLSDRLDSPLQPGSVLFGAAFVWVAIWLAARMTRKSYDPDRDAAFLTQHTYTLGADGIQSTREGMNAFSSWSVVKAVSVTAEHLFIWLDKFQGFVVPLRDLPVGVERDEFVRQVQTWAGREVLPDSQWSAGQRATAASHAEPPVSFEDPDSAPRTKWPATLLRLLALRSAPGAPATASVGLIALLTCLSIGTWFGVNWLDNQPDPEFYVYGATDLAWYALIVLAVAAVVAWRSIPTVEFSRTLAVVLAPIPLFIVVDDLVDRYVPWRWTWIGALLMLLYLIVYWARGVRALSGRRQPAALVSGVLLTICLLSATQWLSVDPSVWFTAEADDETDYATEGKESEPLLFEQSRRIDEAINAVAPSTGEPPATFFVGFAGYAEQRVFAEEIKLAARVVGARFGSTERSVLLVNDRRSRDAYPLASPTALRYALRGVARKMNVERDVLFLALSSHGSEKTVAVSNGSLGLQDLTAADLASALKESGIKWRVIVISACHAGSFIDELRNVDTIVLTAAAPDKTSFGCSDDRDLTYFGEAFYRDALPQSKSLREAFDTARADIRTREKREDVSASNPQAFFGHEIETYLATHQ
jgi:Peptidase C13 family